MGIDSMEKFALDYSLQLAHTPIFLDTETNGYGRFRPGAQDILQISWIVGACTGTGLFRNFYVNEKTNINPRAFDVHGITHEFLQEHGMPFERAMELLVSDIINCSNPLIVCHNAAFDIGCVLHTAKKMGVDESFRHRFSSTPYLCTMKIGANICKIPGFRGSEYKFPKLVELCEHVGLDSKTLDLDRQHDALQDASVLRMVFEAGLNSGFFTLRVCESQ